MHCSFDKRFSNDKYQIIDYRLLKAVESTWYSSELPYHFFQTSSIIYNCLDAEEKIRGTALDMTAHVGGFCLNWATQNPDYKIDAIEIAQETFNALDYNICRLGLDSRISAIHADSVAWLSRHDKSMYSFIYIDPPFGGPNYKEQVKVQLCLGEAKLGSVVEQALKVSKHIFIKVPYNFDFQSLPDGLELKVYSIQHANTLKTLPAYLFVHIFSTIKLEQ